MKRPDNYFTCFTCSTQVSEEIMETKYDYPTVPTLIFLIGCILITVCLLIGGPLLIIASAYGFTWLLIKTIIGIAAWLGFMLFFIGLSFASIYKTEKDKK